MYTTTSSKQEGGYTSVATQETDQINTPLETEVKPCLHTPTTTINMDQEAGGNNRGFDQFMLALLVFMLGSCMVYAIADSIMHRNDQILEHDFMVDKLEVPCSLLNVSNMQLNGNWNITMMVNNRSYKSKLTKDFYYENSVIIILYENNIISATTLPGFYQGINNTKLVDATFASEGIPTDEYVSGAISRSWNSKLPMFVNVKILGWVKYFPGEGWSEKCRMTISCWDVKLEFYPTTKDATILSGRGSQKCEVNIY
uniref:Late embryogenesis abundant protein LEA-2 subgroup domain-containing protein n=1 Tax=Solanum tuberosum TaxID=4113 RepID=M1AZH9_SOLTU